MRRKVAALSSLSSAALVAGLLAGVPGVTVAASAQDDEDAGPGAATLVPLQVTGPPEERLNLIILGDGYTADEMDKFHEDIDRNQNVQWAHEPFRTYRNYFNVYALEIVSAESGISCDPDDGNVRRDTPLGLQFSGSCPADPLARGITYSFQGAQARNAYLEDVVTPALGLPANAQNLQTLALANTFTYGGIGGRHATTSGGSPQGPLISLHELGHSLGNLQDEYPYSARTVPGPPWNFGEPGSIHHTTMTSEEMLENEAKWWRWLGEESLAGGEIRAADPDGYESGQYRCCGIWRPSQHSMMRWLGYPLDQVGREHMTGRISGLRDSGEMPLNATPGDEVGPDDVLWVDPLQPRFHEMDVTWEINGDAVADATGSTVLELAGRDVADGDTVRVTVSDPSEFVRDPELAEGPRMTQVREWTVGAPLDTGPVDVEITNSTPTERGALARDEVVFVHTTHPGDRAFDVTWELNGEVVADAGNSRTLNLGELDLPAGNSQLTVTVTDPADPGGQSDSVSWTVDNGSPEAPRNLSEPLTTLAAGDGHNVYFNEFDMLLEPEDNTEGFVVGEFQLNGDGYYNYFGFPEEPFGTPWTFSHSGDDIKALTYGNLGTGGVAKAAFEQEYGPDDPGGPFVPGFGTHTVEHRAVDAAGNVGDPDEFSVTVLPGAAQECDQTVTGPHNGSLRVTDGVTCLEDATVNGGVTVAAGASLVAADSTVQGGVTATGADVVQLFGTTVGGHTRIADTGSDVTASGSMFNGGITLTGNTQVPPHEGAERFSEFGFEYGPILAGNTVNGDLSCDGNSAAVADFGAANEVSGAASGDCAGL